MYPSNLWFLGSIIWSTSSQTAPTAAPSTAPTIAAYITKGEFPSKVMSIARPKKLAAAPIAAPIPSSCINYFQSRLGCLQVLIRALMPPPSKVPPTIQPAPGIKNANKPVHVIATAERIFQNELLVFFSGYLISITPRSPG